MIAHVLSVAEQPSVTGVMGIHGAEGGSGFWNASGALGGDQYLSGYKPPGGTAGGAWSYANIRFNNGGQGVAHNNMQPWAAQPVAIRI